MHQADRATARTLLDTSTRASWCCQIQQTEHFNFTDYSAYYLAAPLRSQIPLGTIDGPQALSITNTYLSAFADHIARHRPEPLLTRTTSTGQVTVEHIGS